MYQKNESVNASMIKTKFLYNFGLTDVNEIPVLIKFRTEFEKLGKSRSYRKEKILAYF